MLLLSHYEGSKVPIDCKCLTCGYSWPSAPQVLLRGNGKKQGGGCPKCANRVRKTDEEFARELAAIRPNILIESPYLNANKPVRCRCKVCGYTWEDTPHVLLQPSDSNCPAEAANHKKTICACMNNTKNTRGHVCRLCICMASCAFVESQGK